MGKYENEAPLPNSLKTTVTWLHVAHGFFRKRQTCTISSYGLSVLTWVEKFY